MSSTCLKINVLTQKKEHTKNIKSNYLRAVELIEHFNFLLPSHSSTMHIIYYHIKNIKVGFSE